MAKAMSGHVAFAKYCSSPNRRANGLLRFPSDSSGFSLIGMLTSKGVATGLARSMFSLRSIASI